MTLAFLLYQSKGVLADLDGGRLLLQIFAIDLAKAEKIR